MRKAQNSGRAAEQSVNREKRQKYVVFRRSLQVRSLWNRDHGSIRGMLGMGP